MTAPKCRDTFRNLCNNVHRTDRNKKKIVITTTKKRIEMWSSTTNNAHRLTINSSYNDPAVLVSVRIINNSDNNCSYSYTINIFR